MVPPLPMELVARSEAVPVVMTSGVLSLALSRRLPALLVSEKSLSEIARRFGIGEYLQLGRGEDKSGGRDKATLLCDGLEAVLAAVYLDKAKKNQASETALTAIKDQT